MTDSMKLIALCDISTGFQGKDKEGRYSYRQIKLKDVNQYEAIEYDMLDELGTDTEIPKSNLLKKGDILFKAKSGDNSVAIIEEVRDDLIASLHFFVLRVKEPGLINPDYLVGFLNSKKMQQHLKSIAVGNTVPMVRRREISSLNIPLPPFQKQVEIGNFYRLLQQERRVLKEILNKRVQQFNAITTQV